MELSLLIFRDLAAKFLVGAAGFVLVKCGICKRGDNALLAKLCLYFAGPCQLLNVFFVEFDTALLQRFGLAVLISAVILLLCILCAYGAGRFLRADRVSQASLIYSNNGSFLLALVQVLLGTEAALYLSAYTVMQNLVFWTHGYRLLTGKSISVKTMVNPNVLAVFGGMTIFLFSIKFPPILSAAIRELGSLNSPICMIMIGMALASCDLKRTFCQKKVWIVSMARLIVLPMVAVCAFAASGLAKKSADLMLLGNALVIATSGPSANNVLQLVLVAEHSTSGDVDVAASVNTVSTCFCIITIPLITAVFGLFFS